MGNKKNRASHGNSHRHVYTRRWPTKKSTPLKSCKMRKQKKHTKNILPLDGSRIINLSQLQQYIHELTAHAAQCPGEITLCGELRDGLASVIESRCGACNHTIQFDTSLKVKGPTGYRRWECNLAAVWGQMSTGGGHSNLEGNMSVLGIPVMAKKNFIQTERCIGEWWKQQLQESMKEAGREEKALAEENGEFHQGVPAITVIVDGGWSKRSHRHSYNAKSGVAIIIGKRTRKLLYIGVRNKFCSSCSKGISEDKHTCFKNWDESSSQMEADIILEGFKQAEEVHGLRYIRFIGDGDSSVHSTLVVGVPVWGKDIQKMECANHCCKCYRSSLEKLVQSHSEYRGKGGLTQKMRKRLTCAARCAIRMRSKESDKSKAIRLLAEDLKNGPFHCFGQHDKCSIDFCSSARDRAVLTEISSTNTGDEREDIDEDDLTSDDDLRRKCIELLYLQCEVNK